MGEKKKDNVTVKKRKDKKGLGRLRADTKANVREHGKRELNNYN